MLDKIGGSLLSAAADVALGGGQDGSPTDFGAALAGAKAPPLLIASDKPDEGRVCNNSARYDAEHPVAVLRDTYVGGGRTGVPLGIQGKLLAPGQCGEGDAILTDTNRNGRLDGGDKPFKIPNRNTPIDQWNVEGTYKASAPPGQQHGVKIEPFDPSSWAGMAALELKNPLVQEYGSMSMEHFSDIMGDKKVVVEGEELFKPR